MKKDKKYILTFFICQKNNTDFLETIQCDNWFEVCDEGTPLIFCIDDNKDEAAAYPSMNLRKIVQNFGVHSEFQSKIEKVENGIYA